MKRQIAGEVKPHLVRGAFCLVLLVAGTLPFFSPPKTLAKHDQRTLTFAERVAYQRAIEDVYWRHRIWPKERPDPKPSLDAVMSQAQLEKKVADYLRKSQALEDYWQRPLTAKQLQAEIDRMAQHTKQPEVLRELFEALGNDPFIIAECLARPVLTERVVADLSTQRETERFGPAQSNGLRSMSMAATLVNVAYTLPRISEGDPPCVDDTWTATSTTNAPDARAYQTAVWTGTEMIVWGGYDGNNALNTGGRYNPSTDSWTATSTTNAPTGRYLHTAVWTGSEMIVWGGYNGGSSFNTGGRYNPSTDTWTATSTTDAPEARYGHTAVWTSSEMIVWSGSYWNTGGRYNPSTDTWTATSTTNEPAARTGHTAVWTESEMIIWGGDSGIVLNTGGRYNPSTDTWTATSTTNAPAARDSHTAVWTRSEMIVWGGYDGNNELNTGGRYNPSTDTWIATSITNAPDARDYHPAVWAGNEMIIWGGHSNNIGEFNTGGRYDPSTDSWAATSTTNAPSARDSHTAIWSGNEMIIWAGYDGNGSYLRTGGKYCAQSGGSTPTPTPTATQTPTPTASPTCSPGGAGPWVMDNPYPTPTDRYGFAQTSTHFYVFGGAGPTNAVNRMEITTGAWEARAPMPSNAIAPTCALMEATGIVYCGFGWLNTSFAAYNIATDSWTSLAQVPTIDSYGSVLGAFNGKVFLVSGTFFPTNAVWVYDVATNTWSAGTSAPSEVSFPGYRQIGQFLYVVGGWDSNSPTMNKTTTWRLDMNSAPGVWENGPIFTQARADFGLAYDPSTNSLYALGGDANGGDFFESTTAVDQLPLSDWPGGTWTVSPPDLPLPERQGNQGGFYGAGEIWSVGGLNGQTSQFLAEVLHRPNVCPGASPTPTPSATFTPSATATATATFTPTTTATPSPSGTGTVTPSVTPTITPTATSTPSANPRPTPTPRSRPTPRARPTPPPHLTPVPPPPSPRPTPRPRPSSPPRITPVPPPPSPRATPWPRPSP